MSKITRRSMMKTATAVGVATMTGAALAEPSKPASPELKGRIRHSACRWCFKDWDQETFCANAQKLGLVGIDLLGPDWFPTLKKYNLIGTMTTSHGIVKGLNRKENWDECLGKIRESIEATSAAGFP